MRQLYVLLHRYLGLITALFLALAGLTGSVLAFHHELDEWLNPSFYEAPAVGERQQPGVLVDKLQAEHPRLQVWYMEYPNEPGHAALLAMVPRNDPASGEPYAEKNTVFYLDPVSGLTLGQRYWGECCFSRENFMPFMLELHYSLTLPGNWGILLMGVVAIMWVIDCLIAVLLTLPRGRPFWGKWSKAWKIKGGHAYRLNMDIHRAGGLWLWLLLLPVALSSVAMNLPAQVFKPAVSLFSPVEPSVYEARGGLPKEQLGVTQLSYQQAYQRAQQEGQRLGLTAPIGELYYSFEYNFYGAGFGQHDTDAQGKSWLFFHGTDGHLLGKEIAGQGTLGERFYRLQLPIHGGRIIGMTGQVLIAVLGVMIAVLSLTGVYIWWRKLQARRSGKVRRAG
ncbi:PepSY-associated TM helix domain-containing protein [Pseudomonas donghuensis]|uniref:PepSY domain-containing protein n=1 Tax=Pseudomonas donghuensis TaxID=1163398 RepID=A0AAP0SGS1_9PSED|nr:PepSY domain-containing protein [Pseudomonas donghuensis]KDN99712.1 PepSY domain-containing protein [Pseudomonas donghuensis]MCP6694888.1 PepSY domain-containing protein [Pseudomonas donghuensis]MDF9891050.1 putative iron-regulated membrane protein [Pseudomonas vranovensis]